MTMLRNEPQDFTPQVVEPGSPDDPFSVNFKGTSAAPNATSPVTAGNAAGLPQNGTGDGPQVQSGTANPNPTPVVAPVATPTATPDAQAKTLEELLRSPAVAEHFAGLMNEKVGTALRSQQSSYDKRINSLENDLKEAREANLRIERETKLEGLSDDEQELIKGKWALEDQKHDLEEYEKTLDEYWHEMYVAKLTEENGKFGVTAEDLEQLTEPEEMDVFVLRKEAEFYRNGGTLTTQVPSHVVTATGSGATPDASVPAGASAPTDVGGSGPTATPIKLEEGAGMDVMARNLNALKWESLPMPA